MKQLYSRRKQVELCCHRCKRPVSVSVHEAHFESCCPLVVSSRNSSFWCVSVRAGEEAVVRLHRGGKTHSYFHTDNFPSSWSDDTLAYLTCLKWNKKIIIYMLILNVGKWKAFGGQTYRPCCCVPRVVLRVPLVLWSPDLLLSLSPGGSVLPGVGLLSWSRRPSSCRFPPHGPVDRAEDPSCVGRWRWRVGRGRGEEEEDG